MTFESRWTGTIRKGDLVAIGYDNYMVLAIYAGRGKTGTIQYYSIYALSNYYKSNLHLHNYGKSYVNAPHSGRVVKVNVNDLNEETLEQYNEAMIYLEQQKFKIER
jgi:hypothetical protein